MSMASSLTCAPLQPTALAHCRAAASLQRQAGCHVLFRFLLHPSLFISPSPSPSYDEILDKLNPFLKVTGYQKGTFEFIPISGLGGVNLSERIPEGVCPWYRYVPSSSPAMTPKPACLLQRGSWGKGGTVTIWLSAEGHLVRTWSARNSSNNTK